MIVHSSEKTFDQDILGEKICIVDFYAVWCGPCQLLSRVFEKLENNSNFDIVKVDIDENEKLTQKFGIEVVPTLIFFVDGKPVKKTVGFMTEKQILEVVEEIK